MSSLEQYVQPGGGMCRRSVSFDVESLFSNSLIIHQLRTKEITTVKEVCGYLVLISIDFDDFSTPFTA